MSWNYRVVHQVIGDEHIYQVHEAYYDKDGRCWGITENGVPARGDTAQEVTEALTLMRGATKRPVLEYDSVPEPGAASPHNHITEPAP